MEEEEIAHLFAQVVLAMQFVHTQQILHRDLKSQNIFLSRTLDHVKIGDFGISKILSSKSKAFTVVGTPCYISPELCEGRPYNTKSDIWSLGCILYELCACRRAFEAPTLPALIMKIMRGVVPPLPGLYSLGLKQVVSCLLAVEPGRRPSMAELMSHHWLAPYIFRVATTVGMIPCTSRPPRPLSRTRPENLQQPEPVQPKFATRRRSPSPFRAASEQGSLVILWDDLASPRQLGVLDPRTEIVGVALGGGHQAAGVESSGHVVMWGEEGKATNLTGTPGITVVKVALGLDFILILTDHGILLTRGQGRCGCLGHGDTRALTTPRIVEALLGDDVVEVAAGPSHVVVVTNEGEAWAWGTDTGGCLGRGKVSEKADATPRVIQSGLGEVDRVVCGPAVTALISTDGCLMIAGKNKCNRFGLNSDEGRVKEVATFTRVAQTVGPVAEVGLAETTIVILTTGGKVWRLGGDDRDMVEIVLDSGLPVTLVAAAVSGIVLAKEGRIMVVLSDGRRKQMELGSLQGKKVDKILSLLTFGNTLLAHLELSSAK